MKGDNEKYMQFIEERKKVVADFIFSAIY